MNAISRLLSVLVLMATPTWAAGSDREQLLLELFRQNGCSMTGEQAGQILPKHGFTPAEAKAIEEKWVKSGWIDTSKVMTVTLTRKACKG